MSGGYIALWFFAAIDFSMPFAWLFFKRLSMPNHEAWALTVVCAALWPLMLTLATLIIVPYGAYILVRYSLPRLCRMVAERLAEVEAKAKEE